MKTLRFMIRDKHITRQDGNAVVAGAVNHYEVQCSFDADWEGLTKTLVLENGDARVELLYTGGLVLPWEVCREGGLMLSVYGTKTLADGRTQVVRTARMTKPIPVEPSGAEGGEAPEGFTPELAEQVLAILGDLTALLTRDKSTMVAAINEIYEEAGIEGIRFKETDSEGNNVYTVSLSRGDSYEIKAPIGRTGPQGIQGEKGESIELRYDAQAKALQWKLPSGGEWNEVMSLEELQGELMTSTLEAAQSASSAAAASAKAAANSESSAKTSASSANTYKNNAMSYANNSYSYSKNAESYKNTAKSYVASCKSYNDECYDYWDEANEYWKDCRAMTASIQGYYPTVEALKAAVPNPTEQLYYGVGTAEPYDIWYWNTYDKDWYQRQQVHDLARKSFVLFSSTAGSQKKFRVTVDDSGTLSVAEITG